MIRCLIIALLIGAVGSSQTTRNKRQIQTKCPRCQQSITHCAPKYQIPRDHTACIEPNPDAKPLPLTAEDKKAVLKQHNDIRANVTPPAADMLLLLWDDELEMLAQRWAMRCPLASDNSLLGDNSRFIPGRTSVGQNLARGYNNFKAAIYAWAWENFWYRSAFGKPIFKIDRVRHYTQLVWASTNRIGCGRARCTKGGVYYVCNYAPAGNTIPFISPYKKATKKRGDKCKTKTSQGLCDCGSRFCGYYTLFVKNCSCSCSPGPECGLDCNGRDSSKCSRVPGYHESDCETQWYMHQTCPILCGYCPCSGAGFKPKICASLASEIAESAGSQTVYFGILHVFTWLALLL